MRVADQWPGWCKWPWASSCNPELSFAPPLPPLHKCSSMAFPLLHNHLSGEKHYFHLQGPLRRRRKPNNKCLQKDNDHSKGTGTTFNINSKPKALHKRVQIKIILSEKEVAPRNTVYCYTVTVINCLHCLHCFQRLQCLQLRVSWSKKDGVDTTLTFLTS